MNFLLRLIIEHKFLTLIESSFVENLTLMLNKSVCGRESGEDAHVHVRVHSDVHIVRRRDEVLRRRELESI